MMKQDRWERDPRRHPGESAKEKVKRNFPSPDRRFDDRLTVIARFSRYRPTDNIYSATGHDTFLPRFLSQLFKPLFCCRCVHQDENANATRVAIIDAIAVANAAVHADFK